MSFASFDVDILDLFKIRHISRTLNVAAHSLQSFVSILMRMWMLNISSFQNLFKMANPSWGNFLVVFSLFLMKFFFSLKKKKKKLAHERRGPTQG